MDTLLPGINAERMPTNRLTVNVLSIPDRTGPAVLFVHGNVSSSLFWQPMMLALPEEYRPLAIDLRGFGDTDDEPIDATRGLRDFSDDLAAAVEALGLDRVHLVGWSMGGGVVLQYLTERPDRVESLTLVDPVSPFGFGGTRGVDGILCDPWGAGSGGGAANPEFVERLAGKDRTGKSPLSPRQVLLAHYVKPPHEPEHLDIFVESMLSTRTGEYWYPGDSRPVDAWPGFAPGDRGVLNTMAPTHFRIADLSGVDPKPPVLWIRGANDVIVSDTSLYDLAYLGSLGAIPGWPGEQTWPPQPMVAQTRAVLNGYAVAGGRYREAVIEDAGHGPHLDQPEQFLAELTEHLGAAADDREPSGAVGRSARARPAAPGPIRKTGDPAAGPATYPSRRSRAAGAGAWEGFHMSVLVIGKFKGDTAKFQQALVDRADEFAKISEASKAVGGLHHRFGIGDGYVLIVDEWQSVGDFQKFMANPELQAFIGSVGGAPEPPEVIVAEAISSPDEF